MKKFKQIVGIIMVGLFIILCTVGCGKNEESFDNSKLITKYSRDSESGTRDGFFTAIGYSEAKTDDTKIPGYVKANDNSNMISMVKNDEYGIGYISLASASDSGLNVLKYEGVMPTEENVINGKYKLSRNFNYVTVTEEDCTVDEWTLVQGFKLFMSSKEGLGIIKSKDGIIVNSIASASSWSDLMKLSENSKIKELCEKECSENDKIEIKFGGSTSVEKIAKALTDAFAKNCPSFKAIHNHTGSSAAYKGTQGSEKDSVNSLHVGFLSRELNSTEVVLENTYGIICKDGIVVVVNEKNTLFDNITAVQLKEIYSKETIKWSDLK